MKFTRFGALCFLFFVNSLYAQNNSTLLLNDNLEQLAIEGEERDWQSQLEELQYLSENPINLNVATKGQLEQLPFLSDIQIENILAYVYMHGEMVTVYELQLVDEMDKRTIELLLPYVCVEPLQDDTRFPTLKEVLNYGRHEVLTRLDIPFYQRNGYETAYLGPSLYHSLRYQFRYNDDVQAGILGEKDAGEPMFGLHNKKGYDHYSYYLVLNNLGKIKTLALGDYRLSFGQGLVLNSSFKLGKTFSLTSAYYRPNGIKKQSSADEYHFFKGIATSIQVLPYLNLSAFYSHRKMDGIITDGKLTSIQESGLHRTVKEASRRGDFSLEMMGGNLTYERTAWKVGITGIYYQMDKDYEPSLQGYTRYNMHGNQFYNLSMDYRFRYHKWELIGEESLGKQGYATLNRLVYNLHPNANFMLLHRYYSHDYWSLFGSSFGESSNLQNENGWYMAAEVAPLAFWRFFGAIDLLSHPWWKYRISKPSKGLDAMFQATYTPREHLSFLMNYRYKRKERDVTRNNEKVTLPTYQHRLRLRMDINRTHWQLRTTFDFNQFQQLYYQPSRGFAFTQMGHYEVGHKLSLTLQGTYFHTDDYDTRIYAYERSLLNTFYSPSFYGEGFRFAAHCRLDWNEHLMLLLKLGETLYLDRDEIGSGNDLINSRHKTDLQLQLRVKF